MNFERIAQETGYKAYTTEFDRIADARNLYTQEDVEAISEKLLMPGSLDYDEAKAENVAELNAAATKLVDDLREKLTNLSIDPAETTIGILIDTSGSSRYEAATYARVLPLICKAYEELGFETLVVGQTTVTWNGGKTKEKWREDGKSREPGRLSQFALTTYKAADQKVEDGDHRLAALADTKAYRDNLDGEAVAWMAEQLASNGRENKILFYISGDGSPVDDPTMAYNRKNYLDDHVAAVFNEVTDNSDITFAPIIANNAPRSFLPKNAILLPQYERFEYWNEKEFLEGTAIKLTEAILKANAKAAPAPTM